MVHLCRLLIPNVAWPRPISFLITFVVLALQPSYLAAQLTHVDISSAEDASSFGFLSRILPGQPRQLCTLQPNAMFLDVTFYIVKCANSARHVTLDLYGEQLFHEDGSPLGADADHGRISVELSNSNAPNMVRFMSCPDHGKERHVVSRLLRATEAVAATFYGASPRALESISTNHCVHYTFDVIRASADEEAAAAHSLSTLSLGSASPAFLRPAFSRGVHEYDVDIQTGQQFSISAVTASDESGLGIWAVSDGSEESSCIIEQRTHRHWRFPASEAAAVRVFHICVGDWQSAPTTYILKVHVRPSYSARLSKILINGQNFTKFHPEIRTYRIEVPVGGDEIPLEVFAEDHRAAIRFDCPSDCSGAGHQGQYNGRGSTTVRIHDNSELSPGQIPRWTSTVSITGVAGDGETSLGYILEFHQAISDFSRLANISVSPCKLEPPFEPGITEYRCEFDYSVSESFELRPHMDKIHCADCTLYSEDPLLHQREHLSLSLHGEPLVQYDDGMAWSRKLLPGEEHTVTFRVVSVDLFSSTSYHVLVHRACPWYYDSRLERMAARSSGYLGFVMVASSGGNFMAFAKQVQFMDLTAKVKDAPEAYQDFVGSKMLQGISLDLSKQVPLPNVPSLASFAVMVKQFDKKARDEFGGRRNAKLVLEYCAALEIGGRRVGNAVLARQPRRAARFIHEHAERVNASPADAMSSRRLYQYGTHDDERHQRELQNKGDAFNDSDADGSGGGQPASPSGAAAPATSVESILKNSVLSFKLTDEEIARLQSEADKAQLTEASFPLLDCGDYAAIVTNFERATSIMRKWIRVRHMLHSDTGSFIIVVLFLISLATLYGLYYRSFMRGSQVRNIVLEPWPLWIFLLDYAFVGFTEKAASHIFHQHDITFLSWSPSHGFVQIFCVAGLIMYPVLFLCTISWVVYDRIHKTKKLVWCPDLESYADPVCRELKIKLRSPIPSVFGGFSRLVQRHVRVCIPILDVEGDELRFGDAEIDEDEVDEQQDEGKAHLRDDYFELRRAEACEEAQQGGARSSSCPPWLEDQDVGIVDLAKLMEEEFASRKGRLRHDTLQPEERFALVQYVEKAIQKERRLERYGILWVNAEDGHLKPSESVPSCCSRTSLAELGRQQTSGDRKRVVQDWRASLEEYLDDVTPADEPVISNHSGSRLVYPGDDTRWGGGYLFGWLAPGGYHGAKLQWIHEPTDGWESDWQKDWPQTFRYADKWQWLAYDHWEQPWRMDDDAEGKLSLCGCIELNVPFYSEIRSFILRFWRLRVPHRVDPNDKVEMRRWMWKELLTLTILKMKLGFFADSVRAEAAADDTNGSKHNQHLHGRSIMELAHIPFTTVWREIVDENLVDRVLLRLEDTHVRGDEPWWNGCDSPQDGELRVMFHSDAFWWSEGDLGLVQRRRANELVPEHGYHTCNVFTKHPFADVGVKRYTLPQADGSRTPLEAEVQLRHVVPLMKYVKGFKLCVPSSSLDLEVTDQIRSIMEDSKDGEEFKYMIDRLSTLVSIGAVAMRKSGAVCAMVFFVMKSLNFAYQYSTTYRGLEGMDKFPIRKYLSSLAPAPVATSFMQAIILLLLFAAVAGMLPSALCALICMLLCVLSMLYMSAGTFAEECQDVVTEMRSKTVKLALLIAWYKKRAKAWLAGANPYKIEFMRFEDKKAAAVVEIQNIFLTVQELGLSFQSKIVMDADMTFQEFADAHIHKCVAYPRMGNSMQEAISRCPHKHWRFENDIMQGDLTVAVDIDQLTLRKKIPEIVATIQCINHSDQKFCAPKFDSMLTLYKPEGWKPEEALDHRRTAVVLQDWFTQVEEWMDKILGAMDTDHTRTKEIHDHILQLLKQHLVGSTHRDMSKCYVGDIHVPADISNRLRRDIRGRSAYVSVLYGHEGIAEDFPADRRSRLGTPFSRERRLDMRDDGPAFVSSVNSDFGVPMPHWVTRVRFLVWMETDGGEEELVGFTDEVEAWTLAAQPQALDLHCDWTTQQSFGGAMLLEPAHVSPQATSRLRLVCCRSVACQQAKGQPSEAAAWGTINVQLRPFTDEEAQEDHHRLLAVATLISGDEELSVERLELHKDQWFDFASAFGMHLQEPELIALQMHAAHMRSCVSGLAELEDVQQRERFAFQHRLHRDLANPKTLQEEADRLDGKVREAMQKFSEQVQRPTSNPKPHTRTKYIRSKQVHSATCHVGERAFGLELLDAFVDRAKAVAQEDSQIIHYVFLSRQVKYKCSWKPDPIPPHIACVVEKDMSGVSTSPSKRRHSVIGAVEESWNPAASITNLFKEILSLFTPASTADGLPKFTDCLVELTSTYIGFRWHSSEDEHEKAGTGTHTVHLPLAFIETVRPDVHLVYKNGWQCIRIFVNKKFRALPEWILITEAMQVDPSGGELFVCMPPEYFKVWSQVVRQYDMTFPHEWIRFYDGGYVEHPKLKECFMRHGHGVQRWANGQVYIGQWARHTYDGEGKLWPSAVGLRPEDERRPIYEGQWLDGKRHGRGVLRFKQQVEAPADSAVDDDDRDEMVFHNSLTSGWPCVTKVYEGQFAHDLFDGEGRVYLEKTHAPRAHGRLGQSTQGDIQLHEPVLDPNALVSFKGTFKSSWAAADEAVRNRDPIYAKAYAGDARNLELHKLSEHGNDVSPEDDHRVARYFGADRRGVQRPGAQLPDLALAAYLPPHSDLQQIEFGVAQYRDNSEYEGPFDNGVPNGDGLWTLKCCGDEGQSEWLAKYEGQWKSGVCDGTGRYQTPEGLVFEGDWCANKRHGSGTLIVPEALQPVHGYASYEGQWEQGNRHGHGSMKFMSDAGNADLIYVGQFVQGVREGEGKLLREKDRLVLYSGLWASDVVHTTSSRLAWMHWVAPGEDRGRYYFGQMSSTGQCAGVGTLFDPGAADDPEFRAAFDAGTAFTGGVSEGGTDMENLRHLAYHGQWQSDLPHGSGLQVFGGLGKYKGQFLYGQRHGRGTWFENDGWSYRESSQHQELANWDSDIMHGIADVVTDRGVHENVIYTRGECCMPFTTRGPPKTQFSESGPVGMLFRSLDRFENVAEHAVELAVHGHWHAKHMAPPTDSNAAKRKCAGLSQATKQGLDATVACNSSQLSTSLALLSRSLPLPTSMDLMSEATEIDELIEEVLITGGTGDNAVMNGLYFRLPGTYGKPIFRMVKANNPVAAAVAKVVVGAAPPSQRFLFQDQTKSKWMIADQPQMDVLEQPGCAFVEDQAEHPGDIGSPWHVWHHPSGCFRNVHEVDAEIAREEERSQTSTGLASSLRSRLTCGPAVLTPADRLEAWAVVGFEVQGVKLHAVSSNVQALIKAGIFGRSAASLELYGRPVYTSHDTLFLYWLAKGGSLAAGTREDLSFEPRGALGILADEDDGVQQDYFGHEGHWIISRELGATPASSTSLAFVEDVAATPGGINAGSRWHVASGNGNAVDGEQMLEKGDQSIVARPETEFKVHSGMWLKTVLRGAPNVSM